MPSVCRSFLIFVIFAIFCRWNKLHSHKSDGRAAAAPAPASMRLIHVTCPERVEQHKRILITFISRTLWNRKVNKSYRGRSCPIVVHCRWVDFSFQLETFLINCGPLSHLFQWWRWTHRYLLFDRHGSASYGQRSSRNRHCRNARTFARSASASCAHQTTIRIRSDRRGRRGPRHSTSFASVDPTTQEKDKQNEMLTAWQIMKGKQEFESFDLQNIQWFIDLRQKHAHTYTWYTNQMKWVRSDYKKKRELIKAMRCVR